MEGIAHRKIVNMAFLYCIHLRIDTHTHMSLCPSEVYLCPAVSELSL